MAIVETQYGKIEGFDADGLNVFLGIRYAASPVKEKRWAPPSNPAPWTGILSCNEWSTQSWQPIVEDLGPLEFSMSPGAGANRSEDCLFLNIWTPGLDQRKRPVMVWIHGGGFEGGTAGTPMHDGASLARRGDVVVVTINYRLGTLGFLNLNEVTNGRIPSTGNEGLLDQIKALEWVQNNIDRFGGDPNKVTLFGESAGAMSIGTLLAMEAAKGLFHQAILQSGACSTALTKTRAAEAAELVLEHAGVGARADTDALLSLDPQVLMDAGRAASTQLGGAMIFQPCIDGKHLSDMPLERVKAGSADGIPLLVGATRDEWRLFTTMGGFPVEFDGKLLETVLSARISDPAKVISAYREARVARGQGVTHLDLFAAIETDRVFRVPGIRLSEAMAERGQDAFQFLFTWESPWGDGALGSPHGIDIGFVFGNHSFSESSSQFFGRGPEADKLAHLVQDAWLGFAHRGVPSGAIRGWDPYRTDGRLTAKLGESIEVESDPFSEGRAIWDTVDAQLGAL